MEENEQQRSRSDALKWAYAELDITDGHQLIAVARYIRNEEY